MTVLAINTEDRVYHIELTAPMTLEVFGACQPCLELQRRNNRVEEFLCVEPGKPMRLLMVDGTVLMSALPVRNIHVLQSDQPKVPVFS